MSSSSCGRLFGAPTFKNRNDVGKGGGGVEEEEGIAEDNLLNIHTQRIRLRALSP